MVNSVIMRQRSVFAQHYTRPPQLPLSLRAFTVTQCSFASPALTSLATLSFGALIFTAHAAHARDWYILDFNTGTCVTGASAFPMAPTPETAHAVMRAGGTADTVQVRKNAAGEVVMVTQTFSENGSAVTMMWFPAAGICEAAREMALANGALPDMDDLK